jgi:hypothetical protein
MKGGRNMYDKYLYNHLYRFIGQTVTIFTTSGGASGCGFTGVLMSVNCDYVRLLTQEGTPPANPLSPVICPRTRTDEKGYHNGYSVGSVCDIPICKIAAFCHNAI